MMDRYALEALASFPFSAFRTSDADFHLLKLYWSAVIRAAIGPEASALAVPLAEADQDVSSFGTPVLLSFWLPQKGRGLRILYNDPPEGRLQPQSKLFAATSTREQPAGWKLPTAGQVAIGADHMEELVVIADTDPDVADAVAEATRLFLVRGVSMAEMQIYCEALEAEWQEK